MKINLNFLGKFFTFVKIKKCFIFFLLIILTFISWDFHFSLWDEKKYTTKDNFVVHDYGLVFKGFDVEYGAIPEKVLKKTSNNQISFSELTEEEKNYFRKTAFNVEKIQCYVLLESKKYGITNIFQH